MVSFPWSWSGYNICFPFDVLPFQFHHIGKVHPSGIETKNKIVFAVQKLWIFRKVNIDYLFYLFKGKGPFGSPSFQSRYYGYAKGIKGFLSDVSSDGVVLQCPYGAHPNTNTAIFATT